MEGRKALEINDCDGSNDEESEDKRGGKCRSYNAKGQTGKLRRGKGHQGSNKGKGHSSKGKKAARTARSERVREWEQSIFDEIFQIAGTDFVGGDGYFSLDYGRGSYRNGKSGKGKGSKSASKGKHTN
jgi:hypothetical protein